MSNRIKVRIVEDELYPYPIIVKDRHHCGDFFNIREDVLNNYIKAKAEYDKAWKKLIGEMRR